MRRTILVMILTCLWVGALDAGVARLLIWAETEGRFPTLVRYFEYGRSVPGKLRRWQENPGTPGDLLAVAWLPEAVAASRTAFNADPVADARVLRSYGMSFVNNVLRAAVEQTPGLVLDLHAGPGAPPNFTYAFFEDDRAARRPGDVAILGVLSTSVHALAALSNRTWAFEQPAPFTYPVYRPGGTGLRRIDPAVRSLADQRMLAERPDLANEWATQMAADDAFYSPVAFYAPLLDGSPFLRLVRRSLAVSHVAKAKRAVLAGEFPYDEVLRRMITAFSATARADGQLPVVMLIQSNRPDDPDILEIAQPVLMRHAIPYFATAEHADPADPSLFLSDGHYRPDVDAMFGARFLEMLAAAGG